MFLLPMAEAASIIGILVGVIGIAYNLPFTYRVLKRRSAKDIDGYFLLMRTLATVLYIVYGILIDDIYIIVANIVPAISTVIIGIVKFRNHNRVVTWKEIHNNVDKTVNKSELSWNDDGWAEFKDYIEGLRAQTSTV